MGARLPFLHSPQDGSEIQLSAWGMWVEKGMQRTERYSSLLGLLFAPSLLLPLLLPSSFSPSSTPASLPLACFAAMLTPADIGTRLFFPLGTRLQCRAQNLIPTAAVGPTAQIEFQQTESSSTLSPCATDGRGNVSVLINTSEQLLLLRPRHGPYPDKHKQQDAAASRAARARHRQGSTSAPRHRSVQGPWTDTQTPGSSSGVPRHMVKQMVPPLTQEIKLTQKGGRQQTRGGNMHFSWGI